jgi:phage shock protein C
MHASHPSIFSREDTFFGVCEAIGQDLGFNPVYLRIAFGIFLLWNPLMVVGAYVIAGMVVLSSRLLFPDRPTRIMASSMAAKALRNANDADDPVIALAA